MGMKSVPGMFSVNVQYNHLNKYAVSAFPGAPFQDYTGTTFNSSFDWHLFTTFGYANGPGSVGLRWQHLPALSPEPGSSAAVQGVNAHDQFDLFGRWALSKRYELRAGVDNLLDADPEVVGAVHNTANPSLSNNALGSTNANYDTFGRRFYIAVKASF